MIQTKKSKRSTKKLTKHKKKNKSKQLKNKKSTKRLKTKYTRQIYHAGADSLDGNDDEPKFSEELLVLDNVKDDDPRLINFMKNPHEEVSFENSPDLTHIPYLNLKGNKVTFTIINCPSLVSIDYRDTHSVTFWNMNISNNILKQELHVDADPKDYCTSLYFRTCTFDEDCEILFISNKNDDLVFNDCTSIPKFRSDRIFNLTIKNCQNVSFPFFNPNNVLKMIIIQNNEYMNNDVKTQFIDFLSNLYDSVKITTDLPITNSRYIENGGPRDFETLSVNNGWDPPEPTWGNFLPTTVQCDITMDTLITDYLNGDMILRDYINENTMDPNTVFLKCNREYIVFDLTRIQNEINKHGIDNSVIVYECILAGTMRESNTILDKPLFKIGEFTSSIRSYAPLNQIQYIIDHPEHKFWESHVTNIQVKSVVSHSVESGATRVGASHCQGGQDGNIFHIRKLIVSDEIDQFVSSNNHRNENESNPRKRSWFQFFTII